jgi:ferredoxin-NADP reductase
MEQPNTGIYKQLIIKEVREVVADFKTFTFENGHQIAYKAGQYLTLAHRANQEEIRRSYSIVSSPALNEPLTIGVKRISNGFFSRMLVDRAQPGDTLITTGAGGFFTWTRETSLANRIFLFAAGSGITPLFSILKTVLVSNPSGVVILIYSNSSPAHTIFYNELRTWKEQYPERLFIDFVFSNVPDLRAAHLYRESLMEKVQLYSSGKPQEALYYICGPINYMRMCRFTLMEMGVQKDRVRQEDFIIQKPAAAYRTPPDKGSHAVEVHITGKVFSFEVVYPDSILVAARKHKISLPYSCEAGRCGNCVAKCVTGKVWLSYNEVLTEEEIAKGLTLTCVGHPLQDTIIEI